MLTIAYIGNGKSANRYHLPFVLQRPDTFKVKAIYEPRISNDIWDAIPGVNYTTNLDDILKDDAIDLVVICTAVQFHYEYAKQVLESGKNCLVEKPFTETSAEAKELFALAKEKGLIVQAYQNRRFDSDFLTVQQVIESGKLGEILEVEMHFDYFRPEVPEAVHEFKVSDSYLYGHACHTLDQVISYWGAPDDMHYDVRQLLGEGRMNDYFDLDLYYGTQKVSVKSSYFRLKERPSFIVYGTKGVFEKQTKDRQEEHLKIFHMPDNADFGIDLPEHYGTLTYMEDGVFHEEKIVSEKGDYGRVYDDLYVAITKNKPQAITPEETMLQMEMLETGVSGLK